MTNQNRSLWDQQFKIWELVNVIAWVPIIYIYIVLFLVLSGSRPPKVRCPIVRYVGNGKRTRGSAIPGAPELYIYLLNLIYIPKIKLSSDPRGLAVALGVDLRSTSNSSLPSTSAPQAPSQLAYGQIPASWQLDLWGAQFLLCRSCRIKQEPFVCTSNSGSRTLIPREDEGIYNNSNGAPEPQTSWELVRIGNM